MKEIGGYFGLEKFSGQELYSNLIAVNSGRNALLYILKARNIRKLYLPYLICESIIDLCKRAAIEFAFYPIDDTFHPRFDKKLNKNEYIYIVNYYGFIDKKQIIKMKEKYVNVIWDNAQAFFQEPIDGVDSIYTCRKFFGVPDGGYVSTTAEIKEELEIDVSGKRMKHILGRFEGEADTYYEEFSEKELDFKHFPLRCMSKLTKNIMSAIDYERVKQIREDNFAYLADKLNGLNHLSFEQISGPYAYPLYVENGMKLRKKLIENKIYVATLWPNVLELRESRERDFAENILPLPCDQRYNFEDMQIIVEVMKKC